MSVRHLIIDVDLCEDCGNCLLACKDEHVGNDWPGYSAAQPRHGHRWIDVRARERGEFPLVDVINLPHTCVHCEHPSCVRVGKGAVHKRLDGIVLIDPLLARGRRDIVASCPYGSIWWNEEASLPQKCTLCAHQPNTTTRPPVGRPVQDVAYPSAHVLTDATGLVRKTG